jgi:hypothetical protein
MASSRRLVCAAAAPRLRHAAAVNDMVLAVRGSQVDVEANALGFDCWGLAVPREA